VQDFLRQPFFRNHVFLFKINIKNNSKLVEKGNYEYHSNYAYYSVQYSISFNHFSKKNSITFSGSDPISIRVRIRFQFGEGSILIRNSVLVRFDSVRSSQQFEISTVRWRKIWNEFFQNSFNENRIKKLIKSTSVYFKF